jgi:TonB family protein
VKAARKVSQLPYGREPFDTILAKQDRESLNSRLLRAKTEIVAALAQGASKGYRPPLSDQMPLVLNRPMPFYTDTARKSHLQGDVRVRVDFGADGNLRILKVTRFLPDGLEDRAKEAVRDLLFLPAVQQGVFISYQQELTISFRLRD